VDEGGRSVRLRIHPDEDGLDVVDERGGLLDAGDHGNGFAEFTVPAGTGYAMFGLSTGHQLRLRDIDYAFLPYGVRRVFIYEKGWDRVCSDPTLRVTSCGSRSIPGS